MGLLTRLLRPEEIRDHPSNPSKWLIEALGGSLSDTATGITVTPEGSLNYPAVLAAVRVLAESVASLPLILYERLERGKRRAGEHPLYSLLHDAPNLEMTALEFFETGMGHLALWGNFYAEIEINRAGQVMALWPLLPNRMTVKRQGGELAYFYRLPSGPETALVAEQVLHVRGLGSNGIVGYSPITLARQAIGLGIAAEQFGSRFFGNGARPGVVLEHPGQLSDEAHKRLKESWEARHQGLENAHRVAILEEGMKVEALGIPPEDAQFLETRKFQVTEIARIFRVPPHMLGDLERATFANIEHQAIEFVVHTLRPWLVRWERRINQSLLSQSERRRYFAEFLVDGLLRGDMQSRYQAYAIGRQWGWFSTNDVREKENLNPVEDGDDYLLPMNMMVRGSASESANRRIGESANQRVSESASQRVSESANQRISESANRRMADDRGRAAAGARHRLALTYRRTLRDVAQRIVNREANDIGNAARRLLGARSGGQRKTTEYTEASRQGERRGRAEFEDWLRRFFNEHAGFVQRYLWPVALTYAELVAQEIERETGRPASADEVERFVRDYLESRTNVWVARAMADVHQALDEAAEANEDPVEAVEGALEERKEKQADDFADDESIRIGNAVAKVLYVLAGVTRLLWVAFGESCPYCTHLDGATVEIEKWFLPQGEELTPEGAEKFVSRSNIGHPPLHAGCDCAVVAG